MADRPHLAVVGAGPAGLAAAQAATRAGLRVTVVDAAPPPAASSTANPPPGCAPDGPRRCTTGGAPGSGCDPAPAPRC
ncbi:FAD-dependent oxidoreductase [Streptacidiphilus monticola]